MARLDTQINQIYYLPDEADQTSLILTDEVLNNSTHLFVIADLVKIQKKTEIAELKKIADIILEIFRDNRKLAGESLFETSLAAINQDLADMAHDGKKSWLGKLSALVVVKNADNIFLANTGQMSALLYRSGEFLEILNPEKRGLHPLKTFSNFTAGKLKLSDVLLLTTSNLFNYVAMDNLNKIMSQNDIPESTEQISKILKDTASKSEAFGSLFVSFAKGTIAAAPVAVPAPAPIAEEIQPQKIQPEPKKAKITQPVAPAPQPTPVLTPDEPIYAPLPSKSKGFSNFSALAPTNILGRIPKPKFSLPKFSFRIPRLGFWEHLSAWAKFFLVSFIIFLMLFAANIVAYTIRKHHKQTTNQTQALINQLESDLNDANSAVIYRNQDQALKLLANVQTDLLNLKNVNQDAYNQYKDKVTDISNKINHITVVSNPQVLLSLKHTATNLVKAGSGFVIADSDTANVTTFKTSSTDATGKDLFLLNKIGAIRGLVHIPNTGHVVITSSEMYLVNTTNSQFDLLHVYPKTDLNGLRFISPDRLYSIDKANNQVLRIQFSKQDQIAPVNLLKGSVNLANVVDFGVDTDIYLLSPTNLAKYTNGNLSSFKLTQPTDQITSANKLFVANNIYILESAKKRLLIYNKQGALVTQIFFPNSTDMKDLYVDETSRNIYILDSTKLESITF